MPNTRVDLSAPGNCARFAYDQIGVLGTGVTGAHPADFLIGGAEDWNATAGLNRGSNSKFVPQAGAVTDVNGAGWG